MTSLSSLLKFFKKKEKKKKSPKTKDVPKPSLSVTKPKEISGDLRDHQNSGFQSKTPQKLAESPNQRDKTSPKKRQSIQENERSIELVGNYLKNDNQKTEILPMRPQRNRSKSSINLTKNCDKTTKNTTNPKDINKSGVNRNKMNTSLDSIKEMNVKRIIKTEEKLLKSANELKQNVDKSEDPIKCETNYLKPSKSAHDSEMSRLNDSLSSLEIIDSDKTQNKEKGVSGIVQIRDIDLKTAKCVICLRLVTTNITITVCSHIFCGQCLREWLRYSQHCPRCRTFISSYGYSIRTQFNRICIRSEDDYKVKRVSRHSTNFVNSLGAAYLFEAFLSNREVRQYLNSNISTISAKISELESILTTNGSVQRNVNIRYRITEESYRLEEFKQKKSRSEESFKDICNETNPQMLSFWKQVLALRLNSE